MKRVFLSMVCVASLAIIAACGGGNNNVKKESSEGTAEVKNEVTASKSVKGEWEAISPEEDAIKNYKESYLDKTKEIGGFEIGKPKTSTIMEAFWFYGENELENTPTRYIMRFVCGEDQMKHSYFNAYTQAVWDACKKVADEGRIFALKAGKEQDISTFIEEGMEKFMIEGLEIVYYHVWYYKLNGITMKIDIEIEKERNSNNERVQNVIKINIGRMK